MAATILVIGLIVIAVTFIISAAVALNSTSLRTIRTAVIAMQVALAAAIPLFIVVARLS